MCSQLLCQVSPAFGWPERCPTQVRTRYDCRNTPGLQILMNTLVRLYLSLGRKCTRELCNDDQTVEHAGQRYASTGLTQTYACTESPDPCIWRTWLFPLSSVIPTSTCPQPSLVLLDAVDVGYCSHIATTNRQICQSGLIQGDHKRL